MGQNVDISELLFKMSSGLTEAASLHFGTACLLYMQLNPGYNPKQLVVNMEIRALKVKNFTSAGLRSALMPICFLLAKDPQTTLQLL